MSDRPHGNIQKPSEMLATAQEQRLNNRIYSKTADSGMVVAAITAELAAELANLPIKADLKDTEQIRRVVVAYVGACSQAGLLPSKLGLARALGMSSRNLDKFCENHPQHETAEFLELVFDSFSDALSTAALSGATAQVYSIFIGKSLYKMRDNATIEIDTRKYDPLGERVSADKIADKYKDLVDMLPAD